MSLRLARFSAQVPASQEPHPRPSIKTETTRDRTGVMIPKCAKARRNQTIWYRRPAKPERKKRIEYIKKLVVALVGLPATTSLADPPRHLTGVGAARTGGVLGAGRAP